MNRLRLYKVLSTARISALLLVVLSLAVSVIVPPAAPPDTQAWQTEARISGGGHSVALPALNERPERSSEKYHRSVQLTLPVFVLEHGPVVFGAVILPVRNDVGLTSHFVYTQTTSARL